MSRHDQSKLTTLGASLGASLRENDTRNSIRSLGVTQKPLIGCVPSLRLANWLASSSMRLADWLCQ